MLDKRRASRLLAKYAVNPIVSRVAGYVPCWALLETIGRRSAEPRRNPVGNGLIGNTFWIVAEHGEQASYVKNIKAEPRVRVRVDGRWRTGVAHVLHEDDPRERQRQLPRFNAALVRLMGTELVTIRVDLEPAGGLEAESRQIAVAALVAAAVSGVPSTLFAVFTHRSPLEATEAAGSILLPRETRRSRLLPAAAIVHLTVSFFWAAVLARVIPRRRAVAWGGVAGVAIGLLDLVVIARRRWERVRRLPLVPQLADHAVFGASVVALTRSDRNRAAAPADPT